MPDSIVRATLQVSGGPEALAQIAAFRAELASLGTAGAQARVGVDLSQVTAAQASIAGLSSAQQAMGSTATKIAVDAADVDKAGVSIDNVRAGLAGMRGDAIGAASGFEAFGPAAIAVAAIGAGMAIATVEAGKFQQQMQNLQAVLHATPNDLGALGTNIQDAAKTSIFTMAGIAEADRQLAKAGQDANQIIAEQASVLALASATQVSAAEGATAYVTAMKDFNLTNADAVTIANNLAQAVDSSVGTLADMADALKQVGPVAAQAGLDLGTTTAAIAALENAGLQGDAGTALKIFFQRLESPTAAAKKAMDDLGLSVYDTQGNLLSYGTILDQIQAKTRGLSDETKNADLTAIFGQRGVRVADIASAQGAAGFQDVIDHEKEIGSAAEISATKLDTLQGEAKILTSSLSVLATNIGEGLLPKMTALAKAGVDVTNIFAALTANVGGKQQASGVASSVTKILGLDDPNALSDQIAHIQTLRDNVAQAQKQLADFHGISLPGISGTNLSQEKLKAEIAGWNQAIDQEQAAVDRQKKIEADSPAKATAALNADISTIINDQTSRDARSSGATDNLAQIAQHAKDAKTYVDSFGAAFISSGHTIQEWKQIEADAFADIDKNAKATSDALEQAAVDLTQKNRDLEAQRVQLLSEGAPASLVNHALFGEDFGLSKQQIADANTALKNWETYYAATQAAQKVTDADVAAYNKQLTAEVTQAKKDAIQQASDAEVAAATKSADAWKAANAAVGQIDITKGVQGLADAAVGLEKVRDDLAAIGESDPALSGLTAISDIFKGWADETDAAKAALDGYNLTLTETNKAIQEIGSLKGQYMAALDAAEKRQAAGTANQSDLDIIASRTSVLPTLGQQTTALQQAGNEDILGKLANLPDYAALDTHLRSIVAMNGGGQGIIARVNLEKTQAEQDLTTFENKDRAAIVKIKADTTEALKNVDGLLAGIPSDKTITIHAQYVDPQGNAISASQIDNPGGVAGTSTPPYYQPPLPASDPHSSANIDNPGGPGAIAGAVPMAAGGGGAMGGTIQYSDYQKVLAGYPGSPLNNPASFNALTSVAGQTGVDPRILMAIMQTESGYGANAGKIGQQFNYGGMGVNDRGYGHDSGIHATDGGPEYAGYNDFKSFLMDISAWVKQNGSSFSNYQTADGGQAKNAAITQLDAALPLTSSGMGGASTDAAASSVRDQIVAKALASVGQDKLVNYCEQFVEETVQAITGKRGATGQNEGNATQAFQHAQSMGLEVSAAQAKPGDLVYYPDANGGPGHVAIYKGKGEQVSTYDGRPTPNGDQYAVHTEAVNPGARYISVGLPGGTSTAASGAASGYGPGTYSSTGGTAIPTINATTGGLQQAVVSANDLSAAMAKVNTEFAKMDKASVAGTKAQLTSIIPVLTQMHEEQAKTQLGTDTLDTLSKQQADAAAWQQGLQYESDFAQIVQQMEAHTISVDEATKRLAADVGGPLAQAYGQAGAAAAQITAANSQIAAIQDTQKAEDTAHQAALAQIQQQGQDAQRAQQAAQQAAQAQQQAAANRIQDAQTAENSRYTQVQRDEQDQQRQLQFSQQVQATDLQNKLADTQKQQQSTIYQRTAQEQVVAASAQGASTNAGAAGQAAILAAMHNQDLAQKDLNTKAIDDIQLQIREQAKAANLESYNLETETIKQQRKHEDAMTQLAAESTAQQRAAQVQNAALQAAAQAEQQSIQDATAGENAKYQQEKDANTAAIDAQNKIKDSAQASLDAANQAIAAWQQTGLVITQAASSTSSYINSTAQLTGVNTIRNLGGFASGGVLPVGGSGIVGDAPGGVITPYTEAINVTPTGVTVAPLANRPAPGGDTTINFGDLHITVSDSDAWMAEARAQFELRLAQVKRELERKGLATKNARGIRT